MQKDKLIYINKNQFGYHTDAYMHCKYSKDVFDIIFICFDSNYKKIKEDNIRVIYVKSRNKFMNSIFFMSTCFYYLLTIKAKIFIQFFPGCSILKKAFFWKKMIVDIRTASISDVEEIRKSENIKIKNEALLFDHITIITEGIRDHLKIPKDQSSILPLGTNKLSTTEKNFDKDLKMLYVGTLNNRNIHQTIEGLSLFISKNPTLKIDYYIVGDGPKKDLDKIKRAIEENKLQNLVHLLGRKCHEDIQDLYDNCQVGVSYVPITPAYDLQPPTKTYEYLGAGMPCIATKTSENINLITSTNGVLCDDNPESFANALNEIMLNKSNFKSKSIGESLVDYNWENIVKNKLKPILNRI
jgi:glycosyltransferase involved in cell wall biosynthesis